MYPRFDSEARIAVMQAIDEARELGHAEVRPDHVLLGLLANVRGRAYTLLTAHGLSFDSARALVAERHPEPEPATDADASTDTDINPDKGADKRPDSNPELDADREALRAIGIDLDRVREAVRSTFGDDITDGWGERSYRGRGRAGRDGRGGRRGRRGRPHGPHEYGGRGRRGPLSERLGGRMPFSAELREALRETVRATRRRGPEEGERPAALSGAQLLAAIAVSGDATVDAVLGWANDEAALRAAIAELAGQTTKA